MSIVSETIAEVGPPALAALLTHTNMPMQRRWAWLLAMSG